MSERNNNIRKIKEAIMRLKGLLEWSDRIGSDEECEIEEIISMLKN